MKNLAPLIKPALLVGLGLIFGIGASSGLWYWHDLHVAKLEAQAKASASSVTNNYNQRIEQMQRLTAARDKALAAHPELQAEYQAITQQLSDQQLALKQAMIQADPKVAAILEKLEAAQQSNSPGTSNH